MSDKADKLSPNDEGYIDATYLMRAKYSACTHSGKAFPPQEEWQKYVTHVMHSEFPDAEWRAQYMAGALRAVNEWFAEHK